MKQIEKFLIWLMQPFITCKSIGGGLIGFCILFLIYWLRKKELSEIENKYNWWENQNSSV